MSWCFLESSNFTFYFTGQKEKQKRPKHRQVSASQPRSLAQPARRNPLVATYARCRSRIGLAGLHTAAQSPRCVPICAGTLPAGDAEDGCGRHDRR